VDQIFQEKVRKSHLRWEDEWIDETSVTRNAESVAIFS
jgi:hypothetical protein